MIGAQRAKMQLLPWTTIFSLLQKILRFFWEEAKECKSSCIFACGLRLLTYYIYFNSRVTALVNGSIVVTKPDKSTITAYDNTVVEVRPGNMNNSSDGIDNFISKIISNGKNKEEMKGQEEKGDHESDTPRSTQESPDLISGVYIFNCDKGNMELHDHEHNYFFANLQGEINVNLAGELPGLLARAVVNKAIEPRLYILNGNGTGVEFLRPEELIEFDRVNSVSSFVNYLPPIPLLQNDEKHSKRSTSFSFLKDIMRDESKQSLLKELPPIVKLIRDKGQSIMRTNKLVRAAANAHLLPRSVAVVTRTIERHLTVSQSKKLEIEEQKLAYEKWLKER